MQPDRPGWVGEYRRVKHVGHVASITHFQTHTELAGHAV